jgi:hypothetical protein
MQNNKDQTLKTNPSSPMLDRALAVGAASPVLSGFSWHKTGSC